MSTSTPPTALETSTVEPGESKTFIYTGEQIPNQVMVENQNDTREASFVVQAVNGPGFQWRLYGQLDPAQTVSLLVEWPTEAVFTNLSGEAAFTVYGLGIFPKEGAPSTPRRPGKSARARRR
jgi:hypothetical protein